MSRESDRGDSSGAGPDIVSILPERILGFDVEEGVARIGGDAVLYRKLLIKFPEAAGKLLLALDEAVERNDLAAVQTNAHTLKGSAAVAAAVEVRAIALELEQAAADHADDRFVALLARLKEAFDWSLRSLEKALGEPLDDHMDIEYSSAAMSTEDLSEEHRGELERLIPMLEAQDFEAKSRYTGIISSLGPICPIVLREIGEMVDNFDFTGAAKRLKGALHRRR